jgi:hypothetical protein
VRAAGPAGRSGERAQESRRAAPRSESRPPRAEPVAAVPPAPVAASPSSDEGAAAGPLKKRRRRGGRNRNKAREGEVVTAGNGSGNAHVAATGKTERKPHRERGEARLKPTTLEAAPVQLPVKTPGFFHRVAKFFGRR